MIKLHAHVQDALDHLEWNQAKKPCPTYYNKFRSKVSFKTDNNTYVY